MWLYLLQGIGLGFSAAVQPGPFQTYLISQSLSRGWKRTLFAAFAPLLSDGPIIALCLFVLSQVPVWFERFLYIAGGIFILYLAFGSYRAWRNSERETPDAESTHQQGILQASLMNVLSPGPYLFWSLITGPILLRSWRASPAIGLSFLLGFYLTFIPVLMLIIILFGTMQNIGQKASRSLLGVSVLALFCFGLYQIWLGFH